MPSAASIHAKRSSGRGGAARVPLQMPPISEPAAKQASANPPWARVACTSANAGMVTSTTPNAQPSAMHA